MSPRLALSEMEFMYHLSIYHGREKEGTEKLVAQNRNQEEDDSSMIQGPTYVQCVK